MSDERQIMNQEQMRRRVPQSLRLSDMGRDKRLEAHKKGKETLNRASFDQLTGLPTRYAFELIVENRLRALTRPNGHKEQKGVSLIYIDMTGFKRFNDRYGHLFGDLILQEFAHALTESVRQVDTVCRWGGDEFEIMIEGLEEEMVHNIVERERQKGVLGLKDQINQDMRSKIAGLCSEGRMEWAEIGRGVELDDFNFFAYGIGFVSGKEYRDSHLSPQDWIEKLNLMSDSRMYENKKIVNSEMGVNGRG